MIMPMAIDLEWKQVSDTEWMAFFNLGTYFIKQTRGGVFPRFQVTFVVSGEQASLDDAKRLSKRLAERGVMR